MMFSFVFVVLSEIYAFPEVGWINESISLINVVFPSPDGPTKATISLGFILKFIFFNIGSSFL